MATRRAPPGRPPGRSPSRATPRAATARPPFVRSLLLPRAFAAQFGLRDDALLRLLAPTTAARDAAGVSGCARALSAVQGLQLPLHTLLQWDAAIGRHEAKLREARLADAAVCGEPAQPLVLTHFQWLACAVTEWHLSALAHDAAAHVAQVEALRERVLPHLPPYTAADTRRLACFMATGAGKTLVLHLNLLQFLAHGLFEPANVLLLTPGAALSAQHQAELQASGLLGLGVRVAEITKFYVDAAGVKRPKKGVSEATSRYEGPNLLLVDEGHKGGSDSGAERAWRGVREALAGGATEAQAGFTFEYSATFAQIADKDPGLYDDYARCVAIDFGYARFWREGYGKQPRQINARSEAGADFALAAGLLAFYQQRRAFDCHPALAAEVMAAPPLLACVGKDVTAGGADADVALLLRFLARACSDAPWLAGQLATVLAGAQPAQASFGLPALDLRWLQAEASRCGQDNAALASDLQHRVFGGGGAVTLHAVSPNELGLRSAGAPADAYFGVVRVGEAKKLADNLHKLGVVTLGAPDRLAGSLFARLDSDPRLAVLVGAKMFIEGWSSWRVSALGLMKVGRSPGAEIVQLFGRGVRLRGRGYRLKRDEDIAGHHSQDSPSSLPVQVMQSLQVFGVQADYLQQFLDMLAQEGVQPQLLHVPISQQPPLAELGLHTLHADEGRFAGPVVFDPQAQPSQRLQIEPDVRVSVGLGPAQALGAAPLLHRMTAGWLCAEAAYQHALAWRQRQGWPGLLFSAAGLLQWLGRCEIDAPADWFSQPHTAASRKAQAARLALERGLARAWRQAERRWRMGDGRLSVVPLTLNNAGLPTAEIGGERRLAWRLEINLARSASDAVMQAARDVVAQGLRPAGFLDELTAFLAGQPGGLLDIGERLQALLDDPATLAQDDMKLPLPRLHGAPHLFSPVLAQPGLKPEAAALLTSQAEQMPLFGDDNWIAAPMSVRPPALNQGETRFLWDLRAWWLTHHGLPDWAGIHLYVLRNPAAGGLLLYRDSGFAPDFMVWLRRGDAQVLGLVDPKGLALEWPDEKLALLADLEARPLSVPVRGALLTMTPLADIPVPNGIAADAAALWAQRVLLQTDPDHIHHLMLRLRDALPLPTVVT